MNPSKRLQISGPSVRQQSSSSLPGRFSGPDTPSQPRRIPKDDVVLDTDPQPFLLKGFIVIGLAVFGFGGWATLAPLDSAAVAPGSVIVDGGRQKIQHPTGGVVIDMLVRDGDQVEKGQVLLRLDPTRAKTSRGIVEGTYVAARAEEARLLAELNGAAEITFPEELISQANRPEVQRVLDVQRDLFVNRSRLRQDRIGVLETQIQQSRSQIAALDAEHESKTRQMALVNEELGGLQTLLLEGLTVKTQVLDLERSREGLNGDTLSIEARIAETNGQISEVEGQIAVEKSNAQDQLIEELKQVQLQILQTREQLVDADDVLQKVELRSPVSGLVVNNNVVTEGGVVAPTELIMEIVPTTESLVVDARVTIQDIDSVKIGQSANVMLTGFNQATTPILKGAVDHVAADRQIDPVTNVPYFQARITVPEEELARLDESQDLKPGMPADAIIVTGERTVLQYLTKPITQILARSWREE